MLSNRRQNVTITLPLEVLGTLSEFLYQTRQERRLSQLVEKLLLEHIAKNSDVTNKEGF